MVGHEQDSPCRHVLNSMHLGAKVSAMEHRDREECVLGPARIEAERVDARRAEGQRHSGEPTLVTLAEQTIERTVDVVFRGAEQAAEEARRTRSFRVETGERSGTRTFGRRGVGRGQGNSLSSSGGDRQCGYVCPVTALCFPPPLAPGDLIAVVAPSGPLTSREHWRGLAWLRARYRISMQSGALGRDGYLAGSDERRTSELSAAMLDPHVKAIVAARGGYGAMRILDALPWKAFASRPKWIAGFSDVTALHAMAWRAGLASVHAPNVTGLGTHATPRTRAAWLAALENPAIERIWRGLRVVRSGRASGPVVGGNLSLVHAMAAAGRLALPRDSILALEDVSEAPYRVDRMLTSLALGGHLAPLSAIVIGEFVKCSAGGAVEEAIDRCCLPLGIPVLAGAPFGHGDPNDAFVLGARARVDHDTVTWNV